MARARSNSGRVERYPRGRRRGKLLGVVVSAGVGTRSRGEEVIRGEGEGEGGELDGAGGRRARDALKGSDG